jgi:hypothetical protein
LGYQGQEVEILEETARIGARRNLLADLFKSTVTILRFVFSRTVLIMRSFLKDNSSADSVASCGFILRQWIAQGIENNVVVAEKVWENGRLISDRAWSSTGKYLGDFLNKVNPVNWKWPF